MIEPPRNKLGFGLSGPLGQAWFDAGKARSLVEQAVGAGVTHFDTAPFYFDAETRLGAALNIFPSDGIFVSTKTGTRREGRRLVKDFSEEAIRRNVDESRKRLNRDALDLLYLHGPTTEQMALCLPILNALKKEGVVRAIGLCGEGEPLARAASMGFDAIMGAYNILDRQHEATFAAAKAADLLTVAVAPLAQGLFDPAFYRPESLSDLWRIARARFRGRYPTPLIAAARSALGEDDPAGRALSFVLTNPAIDVVMTTTTKPRHLAASLAAAPMNEADFERFKALTLDPPTGRS